MVKYVLASLGILILGFGVYWKYAQTSEVDLISPLPQATVAPQITESLFSLDQAPSQSLRGTITSLTGEVKFLGRTATEAALMASSGGVIQQGENYFTGKESGFEFTFEPAYWVLMQELTEVDIIQTLPTAMVVSQVEGTAKYQTPADSAMTIRTAYLLTQLTGEATIERNSNKSTVTITVASGSATAAYNDLNYQSHTVKIEAGNEFQFNYGTRKAVLK